MPGNNKTQRYRVTEEHCSHEVCAATIPGHAWGHIKSGWFFQRDGTQYCPEHTPEWVAEWRARKNHKITEKES